MTRPFSVRPVPLVCCVLAGLLGASASARGQLLPLSGRSGASGSALVTQPALPGATSSVNTVTPTIQVQGALSGSRPSSTPLNGPLGLRAAVQQGLDYNLGHVSVSQAVQQARSQRTMARSALLPTLMGDLSASVQQINLAAQGLDFGTSFGGFDIPSVVGPFHNIDLRARVSQSVFDLSSLNTYRASRETQRATELSADDARDLVVLAVGGTYLQAQAARARLEAARTQVETANALFVQTGERRRAGLLAQVDVDRSHIQALTQQQRLASVQNDLAKLKINLLRMIGLGATDQYELGEAVAFTPAPVVALDEAIRQARESRADLKAAEAQVRAAERALAAARAERLPTVTVNADYGAIGKDPGSAERTYGVVGRLRMPLWDGGRTGAHVLQAEAVVAQRQAERDDLSGQIEADVRKAFLDVAAAGRQVELARANVEVTQEAMALTRQRFEAGVGDSVEVMQAQEAVATAAYDVINSVFAHNLGKLNLARAMGQASAQYAAFLALP